MKTFLLPVVALLAFAYYPEMVAADPSTVAIQQTVNAVEAARSDINTAARNLVGMRDSLPASEMQAAQQIINEAWLVFETAGAIVTAGDIFERMKAKDDQSTVFLYFGKAAKRYAKQVDISLPWINTCLTRITTPSALAESTKVRDKMIEAHTASRQFEDAGI